MEYYKYWDGDSADSVLRSVEWLTRILAGHVKEERSRDEERSRHQAGDSAR
jgi:hypothetical protein